MGGERRTRGSRVRLEGDGCCSSRVADDLRASTSHGFTSSSAAASRLVRCHSASRRSRPSNRLGSPLQQPPSTRPAAAATVAVAARHRCSSSSRATSSPTAPLFQAPVVAAPDSVGCRAPLPHHPPLCSLRCAPRWPLYGEHRRRPPSTPRPMLVERRPLLVSRFLRPLSPSIDALHSPAVVVARRRGRRSRQKPLVERRHDEKLATAAATRRRHRRRRQAARSQRGRRRDAARVFALVDSAACRRPASLHSSARRRRSRVSSTRALQTAAATSRSQTTRLYTTTAAKRARSICSTFVSSVCAPVD